MYEKRDIKFYFLDKNLQCNCNSDIYMLSYFLKYEWYFIIMIHIHDIHKHE